MRSDPVPDIIRTEATTTLELACNYFGCSPNDELYAAIEHATSAKLSDFHEAYQDFATAAHQCYNAQSSAVSRAKALATLAKGAAAFSEATARVTTASLP